MTDEREPRAEPAVAAEPISSDSVSAANPGSASEWKHEAAPSDPPSSASASSASVSSASNPNPDCWSAPGHRASQVFGYLTAVGVIVGVLAVIWLAATDHPHRAVLLLGLGSILLGVMRGLWPGKPWFTSRHRLWDCLAFVCIGIAILWLSPWTATISPF